MKISVIIPTYDRASVIKRAIDSVLRQSYSELELIIIDDGSTDETEKIISGISDSRIQYCKIENGGVSRARNVGIKMCTGKWVAFLDSDDEWLDHKLQTQVDYIEKNPEIPLVHGEEIWIRRGKRVNQKKIHQKFGGDIFERCLPLCLISPSAVIIKKTILEEVGLFDEEYTVCEDYDLWLKITSLYPVGFIEEPIIKKFGGHSDQLSARYHSMDYYRVKSMRRILTLRDFNPARGKKVLEEIVRKGEILLAGYQKHGNMRDYEEIEGIVKRSREQLDG